MLRSTSHHHHHPRRPLTAKAGPGAALAIRERLVSERQPIPTALQRHGALTIAVGAGNLGLGQRVQINNTAAVQGAHQTVLDTLVAARNARDLGFGRELVGLVGAVGVLLARENGALVVDPLVVPRAAEVHDQEHG